MSVPPSGLSPQPWPLCLRLPRRCTGSIKGHPKFPTHGLIDGGFNSPYQPGFEFILEPIGVAPDVDVDGVMQDAVQDRRGNDAITEHLTPGAEALVGGEDHGAFLIAPADELEEQVGAGLVDGEIANLIDDQQSGHGIGFEFLLQLALVQGFAEGSPGRSTSPVAEPPEISSLEWSSLVGGGQDA